MMASRVVEILKEAIENHGDLEIDLLIDFDAENAGQWDAPMDDFAYCPKDHRFKFMHGV